MFGKRKRFEAEMDAELRDHLAARIEDLISHGYPRGEAEAHARREFGAMQAIKDECRESSGFAWMDALARDFRYAFRSLRKSRGFALTAIATLALCIGANTAIFSVVDAALFRPLPYPQPDRLLWVSLLQRSPEGEYEQTAANGRRWEYLRDNVRTLDLAVYSGTVQGVNLAPEGTAAQYVKQQRVSAGFFRVLGIAPMIGREIEPDEDRPNGPAVAVLSHALWRRVFGADASVIGRKILLRGEPYTVIGVMPADFIAIGEAEIWTPLRPSRSGEGTGLNYSLLARIRAGFGRRDAEAEIAALSRSYLSTIRLQPGVSWKLHLISVQRALFDDVRDSLLLLWAAVGLVLFIGCVNVASLALARAGARRHEMATRLALGGGRVALMRQLLAESLTISLAGGLAGLALAYFALKASRLGWLVASARLQPVLDGRVLAATATASLLTTLLFGLYPAFEATRVDLRNTLAAWGRAATARHRAWTRRALVVCEVALGTVLLVTAGLVVRTLLLLNGQNPGFDGRNVLTASLSLQDARYSTSDSVNRLFDESLRRIREYPGVEAAGVALTLPYERALNTGMRVVDGPRRMQNLATTNLTYVTPGYFETLRIALLRGRLLQTGDTDARRPVAVVNSAFVRRYLRDTEPLGAHISGDVTAEIVGVVADVQERRAGWGDFGPIGAIPDVYVPAAQFGDGGFRAAHTWFTPKWLVRAEGPRSEIIAAMRQAVAAVDPQLPFAEFRDMDEVRSAAFGDERVQTVLLTLLAVLALLLAAIGIYGLIAHSVVERTREFGIRLALGSSSWRAIAVVVQSGIALSALGTGVGLGLSLWARKLIRVLIYGVKPDDALTLGSAAALLLMVAALAALIPASRIARIDPATTLREE